MKNRLEKVVTLLFFIALSGVEYLATTQMEMKPLVENSWDKANHFIAFFVLFILFAYSHFKPTLLGTFTVLTLLAVQIEVVQYFIPLRDFSMWDIVADLIGMLMGSSVYLFRQRKMRASGQVAARFKSIYREER